MTASFPNAKKTFDQRTDLADEIMAADINQAYDEIEAIEGLLPHNGAPAQGDLMVGGSAGGFDRLAKGSNGQFLTLTGGLPAWVTAAWLVNPGASKYWGTDSGGSMGFHDLPSGGGGSAAGIGQNFLHNGSFRFAQRGSVFTSTTMHPNNDGAYLFDRWASLSSANDAADQSVSATVFPAGIVGTSAKLEIETANKQIGLVQFIENKDAMNLIGGVASLSFYARMGAADDNTHSLKAVILSWTGTADAPTKDVVNAWSATPTYVANYTAENTPASLTLTTSWQLFKIENVAIDTASAKNIAVFIFCDQTDAAVDDLIYLTAAKLEKGATATDYIQMPYPLEYIRCARFFQKACCAPEDDPQTATLIAQYVAATSVATNTYYYNYVFPVTMRTTPTVTIHPYTTRTNTAVISNNAGTDLAATSGSAVSIQPGGFSLANLASTITLTGNIFHFLGECDAELGV